MTKEVKIFDCEIRGEEGDDDLYCLYCFFYIVFLSVS